MIFRKVAKRHQLLIKIPRPRSRHRPRSRPRPGSRPRPRSRPRPPDLGLGLDLGVGLIVCKVRPPKSNFEFLASPESQFSTGFIRLCDMAECHVGFIYKPNAFLIIQVPMCDFGSKMIKVPQGL